MKIISLASLLSLQAPHFVAGHAGDEFFVVSPLEDAALEASVKNARFVKCEIGSLPYVLASAAKVALEGEFWEDLDEGELEGESNVDKEEIEELCAAFTDAEFCVVGEEAWEGANAGFARETLRLLCEFYGVKAVGVDGEPFDLSGGKLAPLKELGNFDGAVVFTHPGASEFRGGAYFAAAAKLADGAQIAVKTRWGAVNATFKLDHALKGTIAFLGDSNLKYGFEPLKRA